MPHHPDGYGHEIRATPDGEKRWAYQVLALVPDGNIRLGTGRDTLEGIEELADALGARLVKLGPDSEVACDGCGEPVPVTAGFLDALGGVGAALLCDDCFGRLRRRGLLREVE